ncbi:hypothetical protein [Actinoplanes solisilvae]|uniref:hypothetical protein n=1 Tax=Actinoplanes solisilvae TaxID=2486853 RepID=UPI000FD75A5E|nr:hypothetical protein [Actinoplanes solisilvae]
MTGSGVERTLRTAYPSPLPPAGASTPLPPHIQGAERRSERRTRSVAMRWGLRVLVVGGLTGAAWLLTGTAAQAADRVDGPDGSLLGSVVGDDVTSPVIGLLKAAAQPLENTRPAHHERNVVADILDVPQRVLTRPAATIDDVAHDPTGTTVDTLAGVDAVLGEVAVPLRPAGGPAPDQRLTPARGKVVDSLPPADASPQLAADEPAPLPQERKAPLSQERTERAPEPITKAPPAPAVDHHTVVAVEHGKASSAASVHRHRTAYAVTAGPATEREDSTPGGDAPAAPLRLHLGDVSGAPTSGSGTPTEGGSTAFLPVAIANSTMARHVRLIAADVEARRHDAEAPTVSPD